MEEEKVVEEVNPQVEAQGETSKPEYVASENNANRPEDGIEELLNNIQLEENIDETSMETEANEFDIEIPKKQVIKARDIADADMNAELTSGDVARKKRFLTAILNKQRTPSGR